jgi:hypothetical protein
MRGFTLIQSMDTVQERKGDARATLIDLLLREPSVMPGLQRV